LSRVPSWKPSLLSDIFLTVITVKGQEITMGITELLATHITAFIDQTGYISVYLLMVGESMFLPIPSEAVMPFAGFLIESSRFTFPLVILVSTLGSITGSLISYYIGAYLGEPFVKRFGKYFLINQDDLDTTKRFFGRFGEITILISRFIPVIRHLISLPAGIGRMNLFKFAIYTIIGASLWNAFLAWVGFKLKQNWKEVMKYSQTIDHVVLAILILVLIYFVYCHIIKARGKKTK
jgi:membrane protein DedA with SNARE-associated domain